MKSEQQKQAENLYYQTELPVTEIADIVGVSRRTLHYWVRENEWDTIKQSTKTMPIALAGNCYLIMARLQESILSPEREGKPVTMQEVNAMHKLTVTIGKLRERGTLSENIEMMSYFLEFIAVTAPSLAEKLKPVVNGFIKDRAAAQTVKYRPTPSMAASPVGPDEEHLENENLTASDTTATPSPAPAPVHPSPQPTSPAVASPAQTARIPGAPIIPGQPQKPVAPAANTSIGNRAARRAAARQATRAAA